MKRVFLFLRIVLIGSLLFAVLTNDLSAQSTTVVRRDTLSRADTARIKRPAQARSVSDDLLKSVVHPSPQAAERDVLNTIHALQPWTCGRIRGEKVNVLMSFPIHVEPRIDS